MKKLIQGSRENREMRLRIIVKNLIELSQGDDYLFLMDKFNSVIVDGKQYSLKLTKNED